MRISPFTNDAMNDRRLIIKHALTVLVGQLAVMAFGLTDTVVAGRYDPHALASLSVGAAIYICVFVTLIGVMQANMPMFAELHGAGRASDIGRLWRQSIYLWLALSAVGMLMLFNSRLVLEWTSVPDTLRTEIEHYLRILAWALPPALWFRLYANLNQALGRPTAVTWIQIAGLVCKVPLSVILTFGVGDRLGWGLIGCAYATLCVNLLMAVCSILGLLRQNYHSLNLWLQFEMPSRQHLKNLLRLGLPNGASIAIEVTSFALMALLIARLGQQASASHQIVANLAGLLYMVPLSISIATSARVSYWIGAARPDRARAAISHGLVCLLTAIAICVLILALGRTLIARLYISDLGIAAQAGELLIWLIWYQIADGWQVLFFFLLRCYRITLIPMLVYAIFLWGVGLGGGYRLAYHGIWGIEAFPSPQAFWISSSIALSLVSSVLGVLLYWRVRK